MVHFDNRATWADPPRRRTGLTRGLAPATDGRAARLFPGARDAMPLPPWYFNYPALPHPYLDAGYGLSLIATTLERVGSLKDATLLDSYSRLSRFFFDLNDPLWVVATRQVYLDEQFRASIGTVMYGAFERHFRRFFRIWIEGPDAIDAGRRALPHLHVMTEYVHEVRQISLDLLAFSAEQGEEVEDHLRCAGALHLDVVTRHINRLARAEDHRRSAEFEERNSREPDEVEVQPQAHVAPPGSTALTPDQEELVRCLERLGTATTAVDLGLALGTTDAAVRQMIVRINQRQGNRIANKQNRGYYLTEWGSTRKDRINT